MRRTKTPALAQLVGRRVRELRMARRWRQADLIAHADDKLTDSQLSHIERGQRAPSLATLAVLARALGVPAAALLLDPDDARDQAALVALYSIPGDDKE